MLTKRLEMIFQNAAGKNVTVAIPEPTATLAAADVRTAMESILAGNYFQTSGGALTGIVSARITSRDTSDLAVK